MHEQGIQQGDTQQTPRRQSDECARIVVVSKHLQFFVKVRADSMREGKDPPLPPEVLAATPSEDLGVPRQEGMDSADSLFIHNHTRRRDGSSNRGGYRYRSRWAIVSRRST